MNHYVRQVTEAIQATVIHSPTEFSWFGVQTSGLPRSVRRALTPATARRYLLFVLQSRLYTNFYCSGFASSQESSPAFPSLGQGDPTYVEELSEANTGQGYWSNGWTVRSIGEHGITVYRDGLELRAGKEACSASAGSKIGPDAQLSVWFSKERLGMSPGFYIALSEVELPSVDLPLVRLYWNLRPKGAIRLVRSATSILNGESIPFILKVNNNPAHYRRCDCAVLYICKSHYEAVAHVLQDIYPQIIPDIKPLTPVFTKSLAAGLGVAEDPGHNESFGTHRCRILAEGMIRAHEQHKLSTEERLDIVVQCFSENEISLETPFLNPGSSDEYELHVDSQRPISFISSPEEQPDFRPTYLQTAAAVGWRLCREAIWHHEHCNWLGFGEGETGPESRVTYGALEPGMYSGTSGVAWFLAELHHLTGEPDERRTALGAISQALSHFEKVPVQNCLGLYSGWVGIALAATRVGILLGDGGLLERARTLLKRVEREHQQAHEFDLLYGKAGAVAGLVILQELLGDQSLLDFTVRLGDDLVRTSEKANTGSSWKSQVFPGQRNLTGLSHGTAGVGYALLELYRLTGIRRFFETAELAYDYERCWFDAKEQNWPDFRKEPGQRRRSLYPLTFNTVWCHGAPGIGLTRLRAYEITGDERYKAEAIIALRTTLRKVEEWLLARNANYSLCHGLAGNVQILDHGSRILGLEWDSTAVTRRVADEGIDLYGANGNWPCGIPNGQTPALMLGLAGIGLFYLRLVDPSIPSVLLLRRENFLPEL